MRKGKLKKVYLKRNNLKHIQFILKFYTFFNKRLMPKEFNLAIEERRSFYSISNKVSLSDEKIKEIVSHAVKFTPSSFNSQSARVVILFRKEHEKFWQIATKELKKIVPEDKFAPTQEKMDSFSSGFATILFFEDKNVVKDLQEKFALYAERFPVWSQQSNGMLQFVVWTALEAEGLGASLQHYNPLVDEETKKEWNIPQEWELVAQMPFGSPNGQPMEKTFEPIDKRVKYFG